MLSGKIGAMAACVIAAATVTPSYAKVKIVERTKFYSISGKTGYDLVIDMNRRGPRHSFLSKAIAQTRYSIDPSGSFVSDRGSCRIANARLVLDLTYTYPKLSGKLPPKLARRWRTFEAATRRHEHTHGRIARKLAAELDRLLTRVSMNKDADCNRLAAKVHREYNALYDKYEKMQNDFDRAEHRKGGPVEKSVLRLVGSGATATQ